MIQAKHKQANQTITESFQYHPTLDVKGSEVRTETPVGKVLDQSQETWGRRKGGAINKRDGLDWTYDQAGRVTEKVITRNGFRPETHKFEWNGSDQLIGFKKVVNHEVIEAWEYEYDAFGRRAGKTCTHRKSSHEANDNQHNDNAPRGYRPPTGKSRPPVKEVKFLWDRHSLVAEQKLYADGTTAQVIWHYDPGQPFTPSAREETGKVSYAVKDHLGTPRELISEDGEVQWTRAHLLWGEDAPRFAKEKAAQNDDHLMPFRFQGQQFDEETGLSYNRSRYYEFVFSGYISSDPLKIEGGLQNHSYVNSPLNATDPLGLLPCIKKVVNSNMPHATERGVQRGVFENAAEGRGALRGLGDDIKANGWPEGTIMHSQYPDRVLVPVGVDGYAVYRIMPNGNAQLRTVINKFTYDSGGPSQL